MASQAKSHTSLTLNPNKSFVPLEKRGGYNPLLRNKMNNPLALKTCKSMTHRDNSPNTNNKDRSFRYKSESSNTIDRSFSTSNLNYYSPFSTITMTNNHLLNNSIDVSVYYTKRQQVAIPSYQPYIKIDKKLPNKVQEQILEVQKWMRTKAEEGHLMVESVELNQFLEGNIQVIKKLEQYGVIHTTVRQFGNKKQVFHSLNLDLISHESILW